MSAETDVVDAARIVVQMFRKFQQAPTVKGKRLSELQSWALATTFLDEQFSKLDAAQPAHGIPARAQAIKANWQTPDQSIHLDGEALRSEEAIRAALSRPWQTVDTTTMEDEES